MVRVDPQPWDSISLGSSGVEVQAMAAMQQPPADPRVGEVAAEGTRADHPRSVGFDWVATKAWRTPNAQHQEIKRKRWNR
eukprot:6375914-Amphidinium_carterae.1